MLAFPRYDWNSTPTFGNTRTPNIYTEPMIQTSEYQKHPRSVGCLKIRRSPTRIASSPECFILFYFSSAPTVFQTNRNTLRSERRSPAKLRSSGVNTRFMRQRWHCSRRPGAVCPALKVQWNIFVCFLRGDLGFPTPHTYLPT